MEARQPLAPVPYPNSLDATDLDSKDPIDAARAELQRAEAQFSEDVKRASFVGGHLVNKAIDDVKPILLTVAVGAVVGVTALGYLALRSRREEPVHALFAAHARPPSLTRKLAFAALGFIARMALKRVASQLVHRYQPPAL
jgi:hypothetical protein